MTPRASNPGDMVQRHLVKAQYACRRWGSDAEAFAIHRQGTKKPIDALVTVRHV